MLLIEFLLTAAGNEDVRAFRDEALRGDEAHAAVAAGDEGDLAFEFSG